MKRTMRTVVAAVLMMVASTMVWAQNKSEKVEFPRDINVNGTIVKKGNYRINFDEQTGELVVMDGKTVVAKTPARIINRKNRAVTTELMIVRKESGSTLRSVIFGGEEKAIVVDDAAVQATTPQ